MRIVLSTGEVTHICKWCPARFATEYDLALHMKCFGLNQYDHKRFWKKIQNEAKKEREYRKKFHWRTRY